MLYQFLVILFVISSSLASRHDAKYVCVPGDLPPDPERCFQFVEDLMRQPWTHERLFFGEGSYGHSHIPAHYAEFGCLLEIFPYNDGSGATFALIDHRHMIEAMIDECFFQKRQIGTMRISGVHSGVIVSISGQSEVTTQGVFNATAVGGADVKRAETH